MEKFQDPQGYRAELSRQKEEAERVSAEEEDDSKKSKKNVKKEKKKKKKEAEAEEEQEEEEEEEQEAINLATPYLKKLRGTAALTKMVRTNCHLDLSSSVLSTIGSAVQSDLNLF